MRAPSNRSLHLVGAGWPQRRGCGRSRYPCDGLPQRTRGGGCGVRLAGDHGVQTLAVGLHLRKEAWGGSAERMAVVITRGMLARGSRVRTLGVPLQPELVWGVEVSRRRYEVVGCVLCRLSMSINAHRTQPALTTRRPSTVASLVPWPRCASRATPAAAATAGREPEGARGCGRRAAAATSDGSRASGPHTCSCNAHTHLHQSSAPPGSENPNPNTTSAFTERPQWTGE